jgi:hypothetical protein
MDLKINFGSLQFVRKTLQIRKIDFYLVSNFFQQIFELNYIHSRCKNVLILAQEPYPMVHVRYVNRKNGRALFLHYFLNNTHEKKMKMVELRGEVLNFYLTEAY